MRLARVQLQMKQADAALKTLDSIKGEGWTAIVADLRGEILLSKGDKQGARAAWEAGVKSDASPAPVSYTHLLRQSKSLRGLSSQLQIFFHCFVQTWQ